MTTPTLDLDGLKALRAQATKAPWYLGLTTVTGGKHVQIGLGLSAEMVHIDHAPDAAYIVALVNAAEALIAAAEERNALRAENATLRAERDEARQCAHDAAIETTTRLTEVEHWVRRYNELDQWRVSTKKRAEAAEAEVARLRSAAETRMREDGA